MAGTLTLKVIMKCSAILLAGGRSQRLGFDKILTPMAGTVVLDYSLKALLKLPPIAELIVVARADLLEDVKQRVASCVAHRLVDEPLFCWQVIPGGRERQDSVWEGLCRVNSAHDWVLIHDAARPLLTKVEIGNLLEQALRFGSAVAAQPASDTLKRADSSGWVEETVDRSAFWAVQTPQIFLRQIVTDAYRQVRETGATITDDASAVERAGHRVRLVDTGSFNLKITREQDWRVMEAWLQQQNHAQLRSLVHAINNALNPVVGYTPLLRKHLDHPEKRQTYLERLEEGVDQLRNEIMRLQQWVRALKAQEITPSPSAAEEKQK